VALTGLFWQALLNYGPVYGIEQETLLAIGILLAERLVRICHGQHLDLTSGCDTRITLDEYEQIIANKTGEIDGLACEVGALLARAEHHRDLWHNMGFERAGAQQLYDDYVDLAEDLTGRGQVNHPILYGLAVGSDAERHLIQSLLDSTRVGGTRAHHTLSQLSAMLKDLGAEHYTLACMLVHNQKAITALEALQLPHAAETWLRQWVMQACPL
jgi:geranylgeranyl pyrophosphate synthase